MSEEDVKVTEAPKPGDVASKIDEVGRSLSAEVKTAADTLRAENDELKKRMEALETRARSLVGAGTGGDAPRPVSITRLCRGIALERMGRPNPWGESGYEREILTEVQSRATMIAGTDTLGGYFVPTEYLPQEFIDLLRAKTVLTGLGVTTMPGLVGAPVQVPRQTGATTAYYTGEITAPTASNPTAGLASMYPKALRGLCTVSKLSIMLSNPAMETFVQNDMAAVVARRRELGVLQGDGSDYEPLGLVNTSGINTSTINAVPTDLDDFEDMVYAIEADNADQGRLGWLMNPREWHTLRTLKDGTGRYLLQRTQDGSTPKMLHGYPVATTTAVPITLGTTADRGRVIFGDWSQLVDGEWAGMTFDMNDRGDAYWSLGIVGMLVTLWHDVMVRQPTAFVVDNTLDS